MVFLSDLKHVLEGVFIRISNDDAKKRDVPLEYIKHERIARYVRRALILYTPTE